MKIDDFNEESNRNKTFSIATIISIVAIVLVCVIVLLINKDSIKRKYGTSVNNVAFEKVASLKEAFTFEDNSETSEYEYESDGIRVSDLDFYDMYKETDDSETETVSVVEEVEIIDNTDIVDDKHFKVTKKDGSVEAVAISPNIPQNDYDIINLYNQNGKLKYFEDDKCISSFGVDISKDQSYVDFNKLKKAGCDFVMLRVGARGYQSGQITIDDYFSDNLKRATDADLEVGVYFMSQAVSEDEATEEANKVKELVGDYKLTYPVCVMMDDSGSDVKRTDALSKNDRTTILRAFLKTVKDNGFKPVLYGDKDFFVNDIELSKMIGDFDFWLCDTLEEFPDYPYKYAMWQYDNKGTIDGISGKVSFNISFIDFTLR